MICFDSKNDFSGCKTLFYLVDIGLNCCLGRWDWNKMSLFWFWLVTLEEWMRTPTVLGDILRRKSFFWWMSVHHSLRGQMRTPSISLIIIPQEKKHSKTRLLLKHPNLNKVKSLNQSQSSPSSLKLRPKTDVKYIWFNLPRETYSPSSDYRLQTVLKKPLRLIDEGFFWSV